MIMRWIESLEMIATKCKKGTYNFDGDADEWKQHYEYYKEQYLRYEEELTFDESDEIKAQLDIFKEAIKKHFPNIELEDL